MICTSSLLELSIEMGARRCRWDGVNCVLTERGRAGRSLLAVRVRERREDGGVVESCGDVMDDDLTGGGGGVWNTGADADPSELTRGEDGSIGEEGIGGMGGATLVRGEGGAFERVLRGLTCVCVSATRMKGNVYTYRRVQLP